MKPFVTSLINPSGLALDRDSNLFVSCRNDGTIHAFTPDGRAEQWIEGMGVATGIAFDRDGNLVCRAIAAGRFSKSVPSREIFVFATMEPSVAAYHLAFHPSGDLFVTGPTTSSFDRVYRINRAAKSSRIFADLDGRKAWLLIATEICTSRRRMRTARHRAHHAGRQSRHGSERLGLVGLALLPSGRAIFATTNALFTLDWDVRGFPLLGQ